jgi:putative DNA primase/helicase
VSSQDDLSSFLEAVAGNGTGFIHWVKGIGGHFVRDDIGGETYKFRLWLPQHFDWSDEAARRNAVNEMLAASAETDVFVCPYRMYSADERTPGATVDRDKLHADWDGHPDSEAAVINKAVQVGAYVVRSGSAGHLHVYVPLAEPVTANVWAALMEAFHDWLPGGVDSKKAENDVLRPPGTRNHKGRARGGESVETIWMLRPTGSAMKADDLAAIFNVTLPQAAPQATIATGQRSRTATNTAHPVESGRPGSVPECQGRFRARISARQKVGRRF